MKAEAASPATFGGLQQDGGMLRRAPCKKEGERWRNFRKRGREGFDLIYKGGAKMIFITTG